MIAGAARAGVSLLLLCAIAQAEEMPLEPRVALLDLRPLRRGARGMTDLDLLPEAAALTRRLREALTATYADKVLGGEEVKAALPSGYRVALFECHESLACLRPLVVRLAARGVRVVLIGTVDVDHDVAAVELLRVRLRPYRVDKTFALHLPRNAATDPAAHEAAFEALLGGLRAPQAATAPPVPPAAAVPAAAAPPPSAPEADNGDDVVESITVDQPAPRRTEPPPPPDGFQFNAWGRAVLVLGFDNHGFHRDAPDPLALPYDRLIVRGQLYVRGRYARGRWFEAVASGFLGYSLYEQGPASPTATFNGVNGQASRGSLDASLRELYLGFFTKRFDLRVGQQRVAWGRGDFISPNDVLNAKDLRDPILAENEVLQMPTPMIRGDLDVGIGVLQLVVAPFFIPDRFDVYGTNWAAVQPDAPAAFRGFLNLSSRLVDPTLLDQFQPLLQQTSLPRYDFRDTSAGLRFSWTWRKLDVSHYYHYGYDHMPLLTINPQFAQAVASLDYSKAGLADLAPVLGAIDAGQVPFTATYLRRHHVGIDAVTTAGPFALRLDAAYDSNRVFFRRDLTGVASDAFQAVVSAEYQTGDIGKTVLVEAMYLRVIQDTGPLLLYEQNSYAIAALARWTFFKRTQLELELRGAVGVSPFTYMVRPQIGVKYRNLAVRLGAVVLDGDDFSLGHYYRRNTSVYAIVKYAL